MDIKESKREERPLEVSKRRDLIEYITRDLSRIEGMIVTLYYFERLTFREVGLAIGLSESSTSHIHAGILEKLREKRIGRNQNSLESELGEE